MTLLTGGTRLLSRACRVSAIIWARARRAAYGWSVSEVSVNPDSAILTSSTRQAERAQAPTRHKVLQIKDLSKSSPQA